MNPPVHFAIPAEHPQRAIVFDTAVFDWTIRQWDGRFPCWTIHTGDGIGVDGGMMQRRGPAPAADAPVNAYPTTMEVDACDSAMDRITANGGSIALARMAVPGVGWLAYGKDTEGNIFGVMQNDAAAA